LLLWHLWWHRSWHRCRSGWRWRNPCAGLWFGARIQQYFVEQVVHVAVIDLEQSFRLIGSLCHWWRRWCRHCCWSTHRRSAEATRRSHPKSRRRTCGWSRRHGRCAHLRHSTHSLRWCHRWRLWHRWWCRLLRHRCGNCLSRCCLLLLIDWNRRFFHADLGEDLIDGVIVQLEHAVAAFCTCSSGCWRSRHGRRLRHRWLLLFRLNRCESWCFSRCRHFRCKRHRSGRGRWRHPWHRCWCRRSPSCCRRHLWCGRHGWRSRHGRRLRLGCCRCLIGLN